MRIASLSSFSQLGLLATSYTLATSSTAINEGDTVTLTVASVGVTDGTVLYWTTTGNVTGADFSDGVTTGSVTIFNNSATFTRTVKQDTLFEDESFAIQLRVVSTSGEIAATCDTIVISDRRYTLVPSSSTVNEGTTLSFSVSTVNVSNGTLYWSINHITSENEDFSAVTGSFTLTDSAGTFSITTIADLSTESGETFSVSVRIGSTSGTVVATCATITITDTSTTPISQVFYDVAGTYTWTCPAGVTSVSVLCIGGGGAGQQGGGGGGALAYTNNYTVVPGTNYSVKVGAKGSGGNSSGTNSFFDSSTILNAGGGLYGRYYSGSAAEGGGGGAAGYAGNGGSGQSYSGGTYAGGAGGTASGSAMTAGFSGGSGGSGSTTVGGTFLATTAPTGGAGSGGVGNNTDAQGGGGVGVLGQGSSGAATPQWSGLTNRARTINGGSGGTDGEYDGGTYGGGGSSAGGGGAVRILWPGNTRYWPSTGTDDIGPSGTFTFTSVPTYTKESTSYNFVVTSAGTPQTTLYWTIKHGTSTSTDFVATSGSFSRLSTNTIAIAIAAPAKLIDRTFQLEIRINSTSGDVVATSSVVTILITGSQTFTTIGASTFTVPAGVTSVSVVAVGGGGGGGADFAGGAGGGLGYKNNYAVSGGQTFTVQVGDYGRSPAQGYTNGGDSYFNDATVVKGGGGTRGQTTSPLPAGGTYVGDGGGVGGAGGIGGGGTSGGPGGNYWGSGGGAGGYSGAGGRGGGYAGTGGGGGGGGAGSNTTAWGGGGGGVGLNGIGSNGIGAPFTSYHGGGGSGGSGDPTAAGIYNPTGGDYGGGGGGASVASGLGKGAQGGVRIIWPGSLRQFP